MKFQIEVPLLVIVVLIAIGIVSDGMMLYFQRKASVEQLKQIRPDRWVTGN